MSRRIFQLTGRILGGNGTAGHLRLWCQRPTGTVFDRVAARCDAVGPTPFRRCSADSKDGADVRPPTRPSLFQRFKQMYRDYWYVLVPVHIVTSCGWFGGFYYMAESGVDLAAFAETLRFGDSIVAKLRDGGHNTTGYLAIAYLLYKIATPLRYTVTLGGTTVSINYLKKWGCIKPMPNRDELKKIFEMQKETLKEAKKSVAQNLVQTKIKLSQRKKRQPWMDPLVKQTERKAKIRHPPPPPGAVPPPAAAAGAGAKRNRIERTKQT